MRRVMKQFDFSSLSKFLVSQGEAKERGERRVELEKNKIPNSPQPRAILGETEEKQTS